MVLFRFWNVFPFSDENEYAAPTYWLSLKFLSSLSVTKAQPECLSKNVCSDQRHLDHFWGNLSFLKARAVPGILICTKAVQCLLTKVCACFQEV